ncbi:MAG: glycoside hydrolase superfamily [Monoraphidium minutum]|nr:MAG: glycoside hydrolase superfamily [Monoraphidium minutum]
MAQSGSFSRSMLLLMATALLLSGTALAAADAPAPAPKRAAATAAAARPRGAAVAADRRAAPVQLAPRAAAAAPAAKPGEAYAKWRDAQLPVAERAADLVAQLTLPEKLEMLTNKHKEVPRLGIKNFDFLSECLHGYWDQNPYTKEPPTIFPQPLVMASTFDRGLVQAAFEAVSDEMRAKNNAEVKAKGVSKALTCWTPHMNIFRDPRWGRGSETWGEDPQLAAVMAAHVVKGLQGSDPTYLKVAATCKHFFGYSLEMADGISRFSFNAEMSPVDVTDTYLPAFDACIRASRARGVMCAYNAVDGVPMCTNKAKIDGLMRDKWGFDGYVVSDCNAVSALVWGHKSAASDSKAIAQALKGGTDMLCDNMNAAQAASQAISAGVLAESDVDAALNRTLAIRFRTGQFDAPAALPWAGLGLDVVNSKAHKDLARKAAHKGMVLLKNAVPPGSSTPLLPLDKAQLRKVCVVGPLADSPEHMLGNYYGAFLKSMSSPLGSIRGELEPAGVTVTHDNSMRTLAANYYDWPLESALQACQGASAALVFVGGSMIATPNPRWERLTSYRPVSEGEGLDRENLGLPGRQMDLVKALAMRNPAVPIVLVVMNGGPVDLAWPQANPTVAAILSAGFPGQEGASAIKDVLFGRVSPSGRLPITWYHENYTRAVSMGDMAMRPNAATGYPGRTYRFLADDSYVQYPFGYGLSYTTFKYSALTITPVKDAGGTCAGYSHAAFCVRVTVTNAGPVAGEDVVLLYLSNVDRAGNGLFPRKSMRAFARTKLLAPGASQTLALPMRTSDFTVPREDGASLVRLGTWRAQIGDLSQELALSRDNLDLSPGAGALTAGWAAQGPAGA